jgi:Ca2+-binding EF-hand superfamily protein
MDLEQVKKLKEIFDVFDADNSGQISIPEIVDTIKALNLEKDAQNIISMVESSTSAE